MPELHDERNDDFGSAVGEGLEDSTLLDDLGGSAQAEPQGDSPANAEGQQQENSAEEAESNLSYNTLEPDTGLPWLPLGVGFSAGLLVGAVLMWVVLAWRYKNNEGIQLWGVLRASGSLVKHRKPAERHGGGGNKQDVPANGDSGSPAEQPGPDASPSSGARILRRERNQDAASPDTDESHRQPAAATTSKIGASAAADNGPISWDETNDAPLKRINDELLLPDKLVDLFLKVFAVKDELRERGFFEDFNGITEGYDAFSERLRGERRSLVSGTRAALMERIFKYKRAVEKFAEELKPDLPRGLLEALNDLATSEREYRRAVELSNDAEVVAYFKEKLGAENLLLPERGERVRAGEYYVRDTVGAYVSPRLVVDERVSIGLKDGNALIESAVVIARYSDEGDN